MVAGATTPFAAVPIASPLLVESGRFEHRVATPHGWLTCRTERPLGGGTTGCACGRYALVWR